MSRNEEVVSFLGALLLVEILWALWIFGQSIR